MYKALPKYPNFRPDHVPPESLRAVPSKVMKAKDQSISDLILLHAKGTQQTAIRPDDLLEHPFR